jgi:hypothetical protein
MLHVKNLSWALFCRSQSSLFARVCVLVVLVPKLLEELAFYLVLRPVAALTLPRVILR